MILVVDDTRDYGNEFEGKEIRYARSLESAFDQFTGSLTPGRGIPFEEVWLGYSLGDEHSGPFVRVLASLPTAFPLFKRPTVRIITSSVIAGMRYFAMLNNTGYLIAADKPECLVSWA